MRTDNMSSNKETLSNNNSSAVYETPVIINMLPVLSVLVAILPGLIYKASGTEIAKIGIITMVLTGAVTFYIRLYTQSLLDKAYAKTIIILGYLASISLLLFIPQPEVYSFWMIGGLLVAMLLDNKLGLLLNFNLAFIMGIVLNIHIETIILILIIASLMSILAGALKSKSTVIYAIIIILSIYITLAFAMNNFVFDSISDFNYPHSVISIFAVLTTAFLLSIIYQNKLNRVNKDDFESRTGSGLDFDEKAQTTQEQLNTNGDKAILVIQETAATDGEENGVYPNLETRTSYEVLCDLDNELMQKQKQYSESLYTHAVFIGELSARAAKEIGADELLAKAGGYYHEVGKIYANNYIEEGLKLAEAYAFPNELKAILRQHNIKYEKPTSVEAAIVMLSDNVVSTIEYIEKSDNHKFTETQIIDNIFQMRLDKGTFDASGISIKDFKKLKEFYLTEISKKPE